MVARIGTYAQQNLMITQTLRTQALMSERQTQLGTGKIGQSYQAVSKDTQRLITFENKMARAEQYDRNIEVAEKRLSLMNDALTGIVSGATSMHQMLTQRTSQSADPSQTALLEQAANIRDLVVDLLNTSDDSRYLFAGGRTDTPPVKLNNGTYTAPAAPPMPTTANTDWYEGDDVVQQIRVDANITVEYGVKANAGGFEKLIRALDTVANITLTDPITAAENQALDDARDLVKTAMSEIRALENGLSRNTKRLDDASERHRTFVNFASTQIDQIENIDPAQVITELNAASVQIEASYITISKIQSLSLANFIR